MVLEDTFRLGRDLLTKNWLNKFWFKNVFPLKNLDPNLLIQNYCISKDFGAKNAAFKEISLTNVPSDLSKMVTET